LNGNDQPFIDGNKRAAMGAAIVFLDFNGIDLPEATDVLHAAMIALAEGRLDRPGLAKLFRDFAA
jgi:death on curing protein